MNLRNLSVSVLLGLLLSIWMTGRIDPLVAIGSGALVTVLSVRMMSTPRDYALSGTVFTLGYGVFLWNHQLIQVTVPQWTLLTLGVLSGLFLTAKRGVKVLIQRALRRYTDADTFAELWDVGASIGSAAYLVWNLLQVSERVVRTLLIAVGGPISFVTNLALSPDSSGLSKLVFDLSMVVFIVAIVLGFHTLDTWSRVLRLRNNRTVRTVRSTMRRSGGDDQ